jgi:hypothetical protein
MRNGNSWTRADRSNGVWYVFTTEPRLDLWCPTEECQFVYRADLDAVAKRGVDFRSKTTALAHFVYLRRASM